MFARAVCATVRRMSTITFDTHEFVSKLRAAGFDEKQAEAVVRMVTEAQSNLVTRDHFDNKLEMLETKFESKFDKLSWMFAALIAIAVANFAKQFF